MASNVRITKHAKKRTKQRIGVPKKDSEKNAEKAMKYGITHSEAKGNLYRYMSKVFLRNETPNNMRVYNRKLYLFKGKVLITILDVPHNLCSIADDLQKKKAVRIAEEEAKNTEMEATA